MSDDTSKSASPAATQTPNTTPPATAPAPGAGLTDLMAAGDKAVKPTAKTDKPDLEAQALRAAEHALAEGERAIAAARVHLHENTQAPPSQRSRKREIALRALLVVNVLAMIVVSMLPSPGEGTKPTPPTHESTPHEAQHAPVPTFDQPWARALAAADSGDFATAITTLERYLADNPRMPPGRRANVLNTLAYYCSSTGDWKRSADFARQFDALKGSHSLPEDLVQEAKAALESGDQDKLRRTWARFLLQQRQIPMHLYKHVAEAYLQLGDSYRKEAEAAAAAQRVLDLKAADEKLREEALRAKERVK